MRTALPVERSEDQRPDPPNGVGHAGSGAARDRYLGANAEMVRLQRAPALPFAAPVVQPEPAPESSLRRPPGPGSG